METTQIKRTLGDVIAIKQAQVRAMRRDLAGINPRLDVCINLRESIRRLDEEIRSLEEKRSPVMLSKPL